MNTRYMVAPDMIIPYCAKLNLFLYTSTGRRDGLNIFVNSL